MAQISNTLAYAVARCRAGGRRVAVAPGVTISHVHDSVGVEASEVVTAPYRFFVAE